jgi:hypothetical protein
MLNYLFKSCLLKSWFRPRRGREDKVHVTVASTQTSVFQVAHVSKKKKKSTVEKIITKIVY